MTSKEIKTAQQELREFLLVLERSNEYLDKPLKTFLATRAIHHHMCIDLFLNIHPRLEILLDIWPDKFGNDTRWMQRESLAYYFELLTNIIQYYTLQTSVDVKILERKEIDTICIGILRNSKCIATIEKALSWSDIPLIEFNALRFLIALIKTSTTVCREVIRHIKFDSPLIMKLAQRRYKLPPNIESNEDTEDKVKESILESELLPTWSMLHPKAILSTHDDNYPIQIREAYIAIALSLLETNDKNILRVALQENGIVSSLFKSAQGDSLAVLNYTLQNLQNLVLENSNIEARRKRNVYSAYCVHQLVALFGSKDKRIANLAYETLDRIFFIPTTALYVVRQGLDPMAIQIFLQSSTHYRQKAGPDEQIEIGADVAEGEKTQLFVKTKGTYSQEEIYAARLIRTVIGNIGGAEILRNEYAEKLVIQWISQYPSLLQTYLSSTAFRIDLKPTYRWFRITTFIQKLLLLCISSKVPTNIVAEKTQLSQLSLAQIISKFVVPVNYRKEWSKGLQHTNSLVVYTTLGVIIAQLSRIEYLKNCEIIQNFKENEKSSTLFQQEWETMLRPFMPSPETLIALIQKFCPTTSTKLSGSRGALSFLRALTTLKLYLRVFPLLMKELKVDYAKLLPWIYIAEMNQAVIDKNVSFSMRVVLIQEMLEVLLEIPDEKLPALLTTEGNKSQNSSWVLELLTLFVTQKSTQHLVGAVLNKFLHNSQVFGVESQDHVSSIEAEIAIWLETLQVVEHKLTCVKFFYCLIKKLMRDPCAYITTYRQSVHVSNADGCSPSPMAIALVVSLSVLSRSSTNSELVGILQCGVCVLLRVLHTQVDPTLLLELIKSEFSSHDENLVVEIEQIISTHERENKRKRNCSNTLNLFLWVKAYCKQHNIGIPVSFPDSSTGTPKKQKLNGKAIGSEIQVHDLTEKIIDYSNHQLDNCPSWRHTLSAVLSSLRLGSKSTLKLYNVEADSLQSMLVGIKKRILNDIKTSQLRYSTAVDACHELLFVWKFHDYKITADINLLNYECIEIFSILIVWIIETGQMIQDSQHNQHTQLLTKLDYTLSKLNTLLPEREEAIVKITITRLTSIQLCCKSWKIYAGVGLSMDKSNPMTAMQIIPELILLSRPQSVSLNVAVDQMQRLLLNKGAGFLHNILILRLLDSIDENHMQTRYSATSTSGMLLYEFLENNMDILNFEQMTKCLCAIYHLGGVPISCILNSLASRSFLESFVKSSKDSWAIHEVKKMLHYFIVCINLSTNAKIAEIKHQMELVLTHQFQGSFGKNSTEHMRWKMLYCCLSELFIGGFSFTSPSEKILYQLFPGVNKAYTSPADSQLSVRLLRSYLSVSKIENFPYHIVNPTLKNQLKDSNYLTNEQVLALLILNKFLSIDITSKSKPERSQIVEHLWSALKSLLSSNSVPTGINLVWQIDALAALLINSLRNDTIALQSTIMNIFPFITQLLNNGSGTMYEYIVQFTAIVFRYEGLTNLSIIEASNESKCWLDLQSAILQNEFFVGLLNQSNDELYERRRHTFLKFLHQLFQFTKSYPFHVLETMMGQYQMSLSPCDRVIYLIVNEYDTLSNLPENESIPINSFLALHEFRFGRSWENISDKGDKKIHNLNEQVWFLEQDALDPVRLKTTVENFPVCHNPDEMDVEQASSVYDPSFLLPMVAHYLCQQYVPIYELYQKQLLAIAIRALSSSNLTWREYAYGIIAHTHETLASISKIKGESNESELIRSAQRQLHWLLESLRNSIPSDDIENNSGIPPQLPSILTLFVIDAMNVLIKPLHPLYLKVNSFLLARPSMDIQDVPMFYSLWNSNVSLEKRALLRFIGSRQAISSALDYNSLRRRHAISILMSSYTSETTEVQTQILQCLQMIFKSPKMQLCEDLEFCRDLIIKSGLFSWLTAQLLNLTADEADKIVTHLLLVFQQAIEILPSILPLLQPEVQHFLCNQIVNSLLQIQIPPTFTCPLVSIYLQHAPLDITSRHYSKLLNMCRLGLKQLNSKEYSDILSICLRLLSFQKDNDLMRSLPPESLMEIVLILSDGYEHCFHLTLFRKCVEMVQEYLKQTSDQIRSHVFEQILQDRQSYKIYCMIV